MTTADLEMLDLQDAGNMVHAYDKSRGCACQSVNGSTGANICHKCGAVFPTDAAWFDFLSCVQNGTWETADAIRGTVRA